MLLKGLLTIVGLGTLAATQSPPTLSVVVNDASRVTPGSIYLAPNTVPGAGPYVFDLAGNTLFSGVGHISPGSIYDFRPCTYNKTVHFCLWQGTVALGYGNGSALVLNQYFLIEKAVSGVDYHEFDIKQSLDTTTGRVEDIALLTTYTPVRRDLSDYGISSDNDQGWVIDCHMRSVDLSSGKVLFDWSSLDHVPLNESLVLPTGGINGLSQQFAWDYFHLSSIARLESGDYLVSSRHTSTIYRVSGKDGSIVWRLGGKASNFKLKGFTFSSQHDVRVLKDKGGVLTLSLFDNAYNTFTDPQGESSGKIIELNTARKTARLLQQYNPPQSGFQSGDGGSVQVLPTGNVFIGWGSLPYVTEHTADGQLVYSAFFGAIGSSASSYRAFKAPFTGITPAN
ncbi:MAG: hypothetical protein Q9188_002599 [Gyalolechia gomerana]